MFTRYTDLLERSLLKPVFENFIDKTFTTKKTVLFSRQNSLLSKKMDANFDISKTDASLLKYPSTQKFSKHTILLWTLIMPIIDGMLV